MSAGVATPPARQRIDVQRIDVSCAHRCDVDFDTFLIRVCTYNIHIPASIATIVAASRRNWPVSPPTPKRMAAFATPIRGPRGVAHCGRYHGKTCHTKTCASVQLAGCGSAVPDLVLTNRDLEAYVETSDEWIVSRTGIKKRHILSEGETLSSHAAASALKALEMARVLPEDVDLIIMATSSPDDLFGSATSVQATIGATKAAAFDLTAACSGFVMALATGAQFIRAGTYRNVLVIGADALSRYIDWRDRNTCVLFGDGSGAVLLRAGEDGEQCGLLGIDMHSDGSGLKNLNCSFAGKGNKPDGEEASSTGSYNNLHMNGQEVFKFAVRAVPRVLEAALEDAGIAKEELDWLVLHQANMRILASAAERLGVPPERVVSNLSDYGNTSAASIPIALDEAVRRGDIKRGDVLGLAGFGAGLSWAAAIVRWG